MALSFLVTKSVTEIAAVEVDAAITQQHSKSAQVTKHPVESGSLISDNVVDDPDTLRIEGIVSNFPVAILASLQFPPKRAETFDEVMQAAMDLRQPIDVITSLREYSNMIITGYEVPRDKNTSNEVRFTMTLERITIVSTSTTTAPAIAQPVKPLGNKPTAPAPPAAAAQGESILHSIVGFFGGNA